MSSAKQYLSITKQVLSTTLGNSSVVIKALCLVTFVSYFLSFSKSAVKLVTVIPGYVLPPNFWLWTFVTHSFVEFHIWNVIIDIIVIGLYGKLLEPLWGALEILLYYFLINASVAGIAAFVYLFVYFVSKDEDFLFDTHIHGMAGYIAGFSVAVKQVMPDHILINSPFGKIRNKHIPLILTLLAICLWPIGVVDVPFLVMFGTGVHVSWIYLRFYQKHNSGNRGDMTDSFSFASFFPDRIRPVIEVLCNTIYSFLVKIKVCKKVQRHYNLSSPSTITVSLPGTDPQDAERRRQVALKALDERLSKVQDTDPEAWPLMEEGGESATPKDSTPEPSLPTMSAPTLTTIDEAAMKLPVPDFKANAKLMQGADKQ